MVVVIHADEVSQLQVTSKRCRLASNTLHRASITEEAKGMIRDQIKSRLIEDTPSMCLRHRETDGIAETLSQRPGRHLDARSIMSFGVAGGNAVHLTEVLQIVHADFVAEEMEQSILQHASMAVGQHEAIPIDPVGVLWVEGHEFVEEDVGHRRHSHGRARVARVGLEGGIDL